MFLSIVACGALAYIACRTMKLSWGMQGTTELFVAVIMTALPSGAIAVVIASRYGCNGKFAAGILICSYLISCLTIPIISLLIHGG